MFWANRTDKVAGLLLLLMVMLSLAGFIAGAPLGEVNPFAREGVEDVLRTIHDNFGLYTASIVPYIVQDMIAVAVAALLYLSFRDRSRPLALTGAFAVVAASVAFMIHEAGGMTLAFLANDFFEQGGPGAIAVGDPTVLAVTRSVSVMQALAALFGQTSMGLGVAAFSTLIIWSPEGRRNPPRWLGGAGLFAAIGMLFTWVFLVNHLAGGGVTLVAELAILVMFTRLAVWFLRQPEPQPPIEAETPVGSRSPVES